jgi:ribosomal protein S18 acetylase RimI-like enzyme
VAGEIVIREPRTGDGARLAQIWLEFARYYVDLDPFAFQIPREDGLAEWFEHETATPKSDDQRELVAEVDGTLAGFAAGSIRGAEEDAQYQLVADVARRRLEIDVVATADAFRRRGVARRLVLALETWGRERGATVALATTYVSSPVSVPFWEEGVGYERRAIRYIKRLG